MHRFHGPQILRRSSWRLKAARQSRKRGRVVVCPCTPGPQLPASLPNFGIEWPQEVRPNEKAGIENRFRLRLLPLSLAVLPQSDALDLGGGEIPERVRFTIIQEPARHSKRFANSSLIYARIAEIDNRIHSPPKRRAKPPSLPSLRKGGKSSPLYALSPSPASSFADHSPHLFHNVLSRPPVSPARADEV